MRRLWERWVAVGLGTCVALMAAGAPVVGQSETPAASEPRVIELEMVGVSRFLRGGEEVRELNVVPGETVVFSVDNASGQELGFSVGTVTQFCDPSRSPRWAIPAWTTGVRELTWTVPARTADRRWGHRGRSCRPGTFKVGSEASEDRTPPRPRTSGRLRAHLAHSRDFIQFDADFERSTSAVAWQFYFGEPWLTLYLSRSDHVGLRDFTTREVANDVEDRSVAVCGTDVVVAYFQRAPDDDRRLQLARVPGDGGAISSVEVRAPIKGRGTIDVACTADHAYVAWSERVDGDWHALIRAVALPDLRPSAVYDAGPAKRHRIAVATTARTKALLAWQEGARIRLARFRGDPQDGRLAAFSTSTISQRGKRPILAAEGARVALGFDRADRSVILLSRDGGASFDRRARFGRPVSGGPTGIDSLAVQGRDVVATMVVYYGGDAWDRHRLRSQDAGKTWTRSRIAEPVAAIPVDGFLVSGRGVKLAEAYTDGEYADSFDLRVRRER